MSTDTSLRSEFVELGPLQKERQLAETETPTANIAMPQRKTAFVTEK